MCDVRSQIKFESKFSVLQVARRFTSLRHFFISRCRWYMVGL